MSILTVYITHFWENASVKFIDARSKSGIDPGFKLLYKRDNGYVVRVDTACNKAHCLAALLIELNRIAQKYEKLTNHTRFDKLLTDFGQYFSPIL